MSTLGCFKAKGLGMKWGLRDALYLHSMYTGERERGEVVIPRQRAYPHRLLTVESHSSFRWNYPPFRNLCYSYGAKEKAESSFILCWAKRSGEIIVLLYYIESTQSKIHGKISVLQWTSYCEVTRVKRSITFFLRQRLLVIQPQPLLFCFFVRLELTPQSKEFS